MTVVGPAENPARNLGNKKTGTRDEDGQGTNTGEVLVIDAVEMGEDSRRPRSGLTTAHHGVSLGVT